MDLTDLAEYRGLRRRLVDEAVAALDELLRSLDLYDVALTREALAAVLPALVETYGEGVAMLAAERYDTLRAAGGVSGRFAARPARPVERDRVVSKIEWATSVLFGAEPDTAALRSRLVLALDEYVLQPGRDTIAGSVGRDPQAVRYARVPTGSETCAFCLVLASRGDVYRDAAMKYHGGCDCEPVPVWRGVAPAFPADYDLARFEALYESAAASASSGSLRDVLAAMRAQNPGLH